MTEDEGQVLVAGSLGELLSSYKYYCCIEILNECYETLFVWDSRTVIPLYKILSQDLLDRRVLDLDIVSGSLQIRVEGLEDAE